MTPSWLARITPEAKIPLQAGGHVVAPVKAGISLPAEPGGGWLPDGSRMTWLNKTTITGAGNRTSGPVLRSGTPRLVIQEAWAWLTAAQLVRASGAAALRSEAAAARALRRRNHALVTADEESFTAVRHYAIRSMTSSHATASSSLEALAATADAAARAALHTLNIAVRERHSQRAQKARPKFRHTAATKKTVTGKPQVTVYAPGFS